MARVIFLTHADAIIDPKIPVPDWGLSSRGQARHCDFNKALQGHDIRSIYCSTERKAVDGASIHAAALGVEFETRVGLGENDRSATGYLPKAEFEATADAFFATPDQSVCRWERAIDAQTRIVGAVRDVTDSAVTGDTLIVSHGGVGCLLLCHLLGAPISRSHDQPGAGGGCWYSFDRTNWQIVTGWQVI